MKEVCREHCKEQRTKEKRKNRAATGYLGANPHLHDLLSKLWSYCHGQSTKPKPQTTKPNKNPIEVSSVSGSSRSLKLLP